VVAIKLNGRPTPPACDAQRVRRERSTTMSSSKTSARQDATADSREETSGGPQKSQLLTQSHASHASGISDAIVIKDEGIFFLSNPDGAVPLEKGHGLGLYYNDCRYLSGYEIRLLEARPEALAASGADGFRSVFQLTNPGIGRNEETLERQKLGIRWRHVLDAGTNSLRDELMIENYDVDPHDVTLSFAFESDFRDVFAIRGLVTEQPGKLRPACWHGDELLLAYDGGDGLLRELRVAFSRTPDWHHGKQAGFKARLVPHEPWCLLVSLAVVEREPRARCPHATATRQELHEAEHTHVLHRSVEDWMRGFAEVQSESMWLDRTVDRCLRDLRALRTRLDEDAYFAAGIPWFATLFGRDSLICALQTLAYRRETAAETLRLLAKRQGRRFERWSEEEPGKILHELRAGELARMGAIPYMPFYGSVDATPLFVILLWEYTRWAGSMHLFEELSGSLEAALAWMADHGDKSRDGYLDYDSVAGSRLANQGWKDSGDAILDASGRAAEPPIQLVEVQGYLYLAKINAAKLLERSGDEARAETLRREAAELRERFNRDFWLEDKQFYALALQRGGRPLDVVTSNPGHALWTGIIDREREEAVVDRLMADDMYSGWGIRTLATSEAGYNPLGYHLGTVWPHDNSIAAAGFHRCGFTAASCRILGDLLLASTYFPGYRLPEAFAGSSRDEFVRPVRYPVACQPQAWACGSIPFILRSILGLEPDGFARRLRLVNPTLPDFLSWLRLKRLRVADAEVDLLFERDGSGEIRVTVERLEGELEVVVEGPP
jgi:glycogen debranching enzyme